MMNNDDVMRLVFSVTAQQLGVNKNAVKLETIVPDVCRVCTEVALKSCRVTRISDANNQYTVREVVNMFVNAK